jgi:hypothetical protein
MVFNDKGVVIVGLRNQRPTVNWPGVVVGSALAAGMIAASSCCFWYLLAGAMMPWPQLMWNTIFFTGICIGCSTRRGMATPVGRLPPLDHSDAA